MKQQDYQITSWCRRMMSGHVSPGAFCIDATMGNGSDTQHLCSLAGPRGRVLAFDIQPAALKHTRARLEKALPFCNYELILDSHVHLKQYAAPDSVDCITFNLGYLPGGDHLLATRAETTLEALSQSLKLLKKGGLLSVCIYSGGDTGYEEKNAVLSWLKTLHSKEYLVLVTEYYNRPNDPPIPAQIIKL
ncbi:MAG: class I SAM-dependent methyltransferase [Eubacteriales bacterium]|nr:class I SAM-dependent methyltransferase [Eubacteriales bacterium]